MAVACASIWCSGLDWQKAEDAARRYQLELHRGNGIYLIFDWFSFHLFLIIDIVNLLVELQDVD